MVISIAIPRNQYFELPPHARERKDTVVIDQPHCAFMPHVQALYPEYYDGKEQKFKPTGQKFVIKNGARFGHNFNVAGDVNPPQNISLAPGSEKELDIKFEKRGFIIKTSCNIHSFMYGSIHTFDHPFFVVTRENGEFEISGLPTGVEVTVKAWHEVPQYFENKKMTLQPGVNRLDLEVSK